MASSSELTSSRDKEDFFKKLNAFETQRREAGAIVERWFRFRARRGLGVMYLLFSLAIFVGALSYFLSGSEPISIVCGTITGISATILGRASGVQNFGKMSKTIWLLKQDSQLKSSGGNFRLALIMAFGLWPWIAYASAALLGLQVYEITFALIWLAELVLYRVVITHRNKNPILEQRVEDWIVLIAFPSAAIASAIPILANGSSFSAFVFIAPFLLIAGLKSLYEAPKELVNNLDR